jgi:DNA-binding MarR family transcriptional regulator
MTGDSDLAECAECLCLSARRTARALTRSYDQALRPHGLRITQFSILTMLALAGPLPLRVLGAKQSLERTTLVRSLARLEAAGWVEVRKGAGGPADIVAITPAGRDKLIVAKPAWAAAQAAALESLGPSAVAAMSAISNPRSR